VHYLTQKYLSEQEAYNHQPSYVNLRACAKCFGIYVYREISFQLDGYPFSYVRRGSHLHAFSCSPWDNVGTVGCSPPGEWPGVRVVTEVYFGHDFDAAWSALISAGGAVWDNWGNPVCTICPYPPVPCGCTAQIGANVVDLCTIPVNDIDGPCI